MHANYGKSACIIWLRSYNSGAQYQHAIIDIREHYFDRKEGMLVSCHAAREGVQKHSMPYRYKITLT